MSRHILIAGLGLIGGSAGIALRRKGWRVSYVDPAVELHDARDAGAADERVADVTAADLVLLATPVDVAVRLLPSIHAPAVTSACSVMAPLRAVAGSNFVAGHPMAGSQDRGLAAARGDLFEGQRWFVEADDDTVDAMLRDCGAVRERVDAAEHDAAVALTSHLPQLLSTALAAHLHDHPEVLRFAGSGLRTFLRLAGSDASVWEPVFAANRVPVDEHLHAVTEIARRILDGDPADAFENAQKVWRSL